MADEGFKLPASSYEELTKIIMGYGKIKDPVGPGEISRLTGQNEDNVSKNNPFLVSIGIVQGGKKKAATDSGYALARALEHEMPDEIVKNWRDIVLVNDFFQKVLSAIKIRKGMDASTLQAHVAYSAGQPKSPRVMAGAKAVIDILRASGFILEQDGKYTVAPEEVPVSEPTNGSEEPDASEQGKQGPKAQQQPIVFGQLASEASVGVSIQIQIHCSASEVDGLGVKLKQLLKDLSAPDNERESIPKVSIGVSEPLLQKESPLEESSDNKASDGSGQPESKSVNPAE